MTQTPLNEGTPSQSVEKPSLWMTMTCTFANAGARTGVVDNIAVKMESADDTTNWLFSPYAVLDSVTSKHMKDSFYPLTVPGKQTASLTYLFFGETGLSGFDEVQLTPHRFKMTLFTWTDGETRWREQQQFGINFDKDVVGQLAHGVVFVTPFIESQERFRLLR